jgi:hypothetical protein
LRIETGRTQLVDAASDDQRRAVHLLALRPRRHVVDELTRRFGVLHGVLLAAIELVRRREQHERRVVREHVEKAERREVHDAGGAQRGDPPDRSRHDARFERVVGQAVIVLVCLVIHALTRRASTSAVAQVS